MNLALANGPIDIVVNAVGVVAFGPVSDVSIDAMEELFLTNVFVPKMPEGKHPSFVAQRIVDAIESGVSDLPSSAFG